LSLYTSTLSNSWRKCHGFFFVNIWVIV